MPYEADISRANPSLFIFLIDQSSSMSNVVGGEQSVRKMDVVADAMNNLLSALIEKCSKDEGVRDWYHVAVLGYRGGSAQSALTFDRSGREVLPISFFADNVLRLETRNKKTHDGAGGIIDAPVEFPIWVEPVAGGLTPMCGALSRAKHLASIWIADHPGCFPPITLNLTDGEANDGDPIQPASELHALTVEDGQALLFNLHISGAGGPPIKFPDTDAGLPDQFARKLFNMSSVLPPKMRSYAAQNGHVMTDSSRGFVYNADIVSIIQFLDTGTRIS